LYGIEGCGLGLNFSQKNLWGKYWVLPLATYNADVPTTLGKDGHRPAFISDPGIVLPRTAPRPEPWERQAASRGVFGGVPDPSLAALAALDHYVSQAHLKNFHSPALDGLMHAIRKSDLTAVCKTRLRRDAGVAGVSLESMVLI
jgi:hypothetical protein